jgi:hypothetical protein
LKFWTLPAGEESWSLARKDGEKNKHVKQTPDHRELFVTTFSQQTMSGRVLLVDLATHDSQVILDEPNLWPRPPVFHPDGKWMILSGSRVPVAGNSCGKRYRSRSKAAASALATLPPAVPKTSLPSSIPVSAVFSRTATRWLPAPPCCCGLREPPGKRPRSVGQSFEAAGTLVGGKKRLGRLSGQVVLVRATWCKPCVAGF